MLLNYATTPSFLLQTIYIASHSSPDSWIGREGDVAKVRIQTYSIAHSQIGAVIGLPPKQSDLTPIPIFQRNTTANPYLKGNWPLARIGNHRLFPG